MRRLAELAAEGEVGTPAATHYSIMGYILEPTELVQRTAPAIIDAMRAGQRGRSGRTGSRP